MKRMNGIEHDIIRMKGVLYPYRKRGETMNDLVLRSVGLIANTNGIPMKNISPKTQLRGLLEMERRIKEKRK